MNCFLFNPARRDLGSLFERYFSKRVLAKSKGTHNLEHEHWLNFFYWLEGQELKNFEADAYRPELTPENRKVVFYRGLAYTEFNFNENKDLLPVYFKSNNYYPVPSNKSSQGYYYNIDRNADLYLSTVGPHSFINSGQPVLSAGFVIFKDGKIKKIDSNSGHYKPRKLALNKRYK